MVDRTVAASVRIAFLLAISSGLADAGPPKRSREAILADYRAHTDTYYANIRVEAFKLADEGDTTKIAELREADCVAGAPRRGTYEEELCALYDG